jgi:hypothetical protein
MRKRGYIIDTGHNVVSTDLVNRGYGQWGVDFLLEHRRCKKTGVITNPPFKLAEQFIRKTFEIGAVYVAMFLKATYWHAERRTDLFYDHPPRIIYAMNWRPDFNGCGQPTMDCIWCVWRGGSTQTEYRILSRPEARR